MPREPASGKRRQNGPPDSGAPAEKKSTRDQAFKDLMAGFDAKRSCVKNQKTTVTREDCKLFHSVARDAELKSHAEWVSKQHFAPVSFTTYDFLVHRYDKVRKYEELAELELKTPLESLHENDKLILKELKLYGEKLAYNQIYEVNGNYRAWPVENPNVAEAINTKRRELKKRLLAGEKVENELSICREIVRAFNFYVLRPNILSEFASEIQWGRQEEGKEKGKGKGKGKGKEKEKGGLAGADVLDWESDLGKHIISLDKKSYPSYEDAIPKVQNLIKKRRWPDTAKPDTEQISTIVDRVTKLRNEAKEAQKQPVQLPDEDNDGRLWVLLERRLKRLNDLHEYYNNLNLMDLEALTLPNTLPNKIMVSVAKAYIVKLAKQLRFLHIEDKQKKRKPTPKEIIKMRVEVLKKAGMLEESTDDRKQLIEMMRQFGDRAWDGEEDRLEIVDETVYYFEKLEPEDVTKRTIQAKYVNGLMDAYKKRFPHNDWLYPTESYFQVADWM